MRFSKPAISAVIFFIALSLSAPAAWSQATGSILGTVTDTSSALVVGAKVIVTNVNTNISHEAITNSAGYYQIDNLIPGEYTVAAEMAGFKKAIRSAFELQVAVRPRLGLEVGEVSQSVDVRGSFHNSWALVTTSLHSQEAGE